ncbi:MAG: Trk system potassium transporter TrkA [Alphaproteobacteria bacterium]
MKVIICGAGQVGSNIARHLAAEANDVTVIDSSPELIQKISDTLDVKAMVGFASYPNVLEQAGAADADMIIAATYSDEVNMVACQVAHSLFNVPTKVARVRQQIYLREDYLALFSADHMPIDVIISPELEVARSIARRLLLPGASEMIPLADDMVRLVGVRLGEDCPIINTPLRQLTALFPDLNINIVAIMRGDSQFVPHGDDQMLPKDEVYFVADTSHLMRAMAAFGHEEAEAQRIVIVGGGNIGLCLAELLEQRQPAVSTKIIEFNRERAEHIAQALSRTMVLHGDALDPEILEEANVRKTETLIALTDHDETNILCSLLAKRYGCQRTVALINKQTYNSLFAVLDIDAVVNPRAITVSTILQHVRRGRVRAVHTIGDGFGEVLEVEALETSGIVGLPIRDLKLPQGAIVGAIVRDGEVVIPRGSAVVRANDRVIVFSTEMVVKKVEKMFAVRLEYF